MYFINVVCLTLFTLIIQKENGQISQISSVISFVYQFVFLFLSNKCIPKELKKLKWSISTSDFEQ